MHLREHVHLEEVFHYEHIEEKICHHNNLLVLDVLMDVQYDPVMVFNMILREVQTKAILFLKSMSESVGSDILYVTYNDSEIDRRLRFLNSESFYVGSDSIRHLFQK